MGVERRFRVFSRLGRSTHSLYVRTTTKQRQVYAEGSNQNCRIRGLYKARGRGRQLECSLCKGPGATVDCTTTKATKCEEVFHFEVRCGVVRCNAV